MSDTSKPPVLSACNFTIFEQPFIYGFVDNYLPAGLYEQLVRDFPDPHGYGFSKTLEYGKTYSTYQAGESIEWIESVSRGWAATIRTLSSRPYIGDCERWARPFLSRVRKRVAHKRWRVWPEEKAGLSDLSVQFDCEFSSLRRSTSLPPHTDRMSKILSFVLYFPPLDWRPEWGGGTELYRPRDPRFNRNWSNFRLPRSCMELVFDSGFVPNRLLFFVKTQNSWHGVAPLQCPPEVARRTFNFNIEISAESRGRFVNRVTEAFYHKVESPLYRSMFSARRRRSASENEALKPPTGRTPN